MKPILIAGSTIVTLALIFYSIAFFNFHKKKVFTKKILFFQTTGLFLDITATIFMIIGSSNSPFTIHGILGYSSLSLMIIDTLIFWINRNLSISPRSVILYSRIAYIWWIIAYITGSMLVMLK